MRQTFSSISAAARLAAVNRQTGAWTAAARRQKARQVAVNRQTGTWTADTGRHTPHRLETCTCGHKITEQATGKTFYPDILYRHPWKERELVTGMQPLQRAAAHGALYDMEAAAVYQAGIRFFSPDRMLFLKVVSDFGIAGQERMTAEALTGLLEQYVKEVAAFLTNLREAADEEETLRNDGILQEDETVLERLFAALHCSQTMRASARQYITYAALTGYDWKAELEEWYARGLLPCKDRREGKVRLEELKQVLL